LTLSPNGEQSIKEEKEMLRTKTLKEGYKTITSKEAWKAFKPSKAPKAMANYTIDRLCKLITVPYDYYRDWKAMHLQVKADRPKLEALNPKTKRLRKPVHVMTNELLGNLPCVVFSDLLGSFNYLNTQRKMTRFL